MGTVVTSPCEHDTRKKPECGACTGPDQLDVLEQRIDDGISALHEQCVDGSLPRIILGKLEILAWVKQAITEIRQQVKK